MKNLSSVLLLRKSLVVLSLFLGLSSQIFAYEFYKVSQGSCTPIPCPPPYLLPTQPLKTIGLQATDRIFGDTIALGLDGFPALAVGDRVVFSLNGGATFIDNNFGLEEWSGGAGTGVTDFSVLQTAAPSGSARIEFLMQESAVPRPLAGVRMFILSGTEPGGAITGQSVKVNLPQVPGLDIVLKAEVFDAGNNLKGTALIVMFESTLEPGLSEQQTRQAIANQIGQQMQRRASFGPGLAGLLTGHGFGGQGLQGVGGELAPLLGRLEQSLLGGSLPLSLSLDLDGDLQSGEFAFSTNAYRQWQQRSNANQRSAVGSAQSGSNDAVLADSTNLWIKGRFGKSSDSRRDDEVKSDFGFVYIGADVPYSTNTRLGLMAEVDWFEEKAAGTGADGEGRGWMVGPYLVSRLAENLIADVRGAYGQSDNKISPIGTFSDSYDTQRWLLEANLTGQWEDGNWEVLPAIGLQYQEETQEAYIDTVGQRIGGQTVSLGSLSFGPTVYYNLERNDGSIIRPMLGLKGIWNFDNPDLYNINRTSGLSGQPFGDDKLRAQLKLGIQASLSSGAHWQGSYTYDGIGVSGLDAHAVELSVSTLLGESGPFKGVKLIGDFRMSDASDEQLDVKLSVPLP